MSYQKLIDQLRDVDNNPLSLFGQAANAIEALTSPGIHDFSRYQSATEATKSARNAYEAASVRLELVRMRERIAELNSQAEPLGSLEIDREKVRQVLTYVSCGRLKP